jgi:hypothetical protein
METLDFLLDRPMSLFLVLALGAAIGIGVERITGPFDAQRRKAYWRGRNDAKRKGKGKGKGKVVPANPAERKAAPEADFAADQLKIVSTADFTARAA